RTPAGTGPGATRTSHEPPGGQWRARRSNTVQSTRVGGLGSTPGPPGKGGHRGPTLSNDPSAGSPTETLLRLLLPLNDQVWITFQFLAAVASCQNPIRKPH